MEKENPRSFLVFHFKQLFYIMNVLVYVDIDQGIYKVKLKVALNEKRKNYMGFLFP